MRSFIRRHFAATDFPLESGSKLTLVRAVGPLTGWCGQQCPFEIWARPRGTLVKVLEGSGQTVHLGTDGSAEIAAEANAFTESYTTFKWTGLTFAKTGWYDTQGSHSAIAAGRAIVFDSGSSGATVTGETHGGRPGEAYDLTARAGQRLTVNVLHSTDVGHIAVEQGSTTIAIAKGSSLAIRLPKDGHYELAVLRDGTKFGTYTLDVQIR